MSERISVPVMLCCNDHRNGMHQGFVEHIEVGGRDGDVFLALDGYCRASDGPFEVEAGGRRVAVLRIGRHRYRVRGYTTWAGNWCWDQSRMPPGEAARLLNNLRTSNRWSPHEGHSWVWDLWKSGEPFTSQHFVDAERLAEEWEAAHP